MPITVLSPHSGNQTKIRDQDVGRAVQDAEGRTFYVLPDENGDYYAALTRAGGPKDIERYRHMASRAGFVTEVTDKSRPAEVYRHHPAAHPPESFPFAKILAWLLVLGALTAGAWFLARKGYVRIPGAAAPTAGHP